MAKWLLFFGIIGLSACGAAPVEVTTSAERPTRIVSLDYCADQYVLKLADRGSILAVSPDAGRPFSYMHAAAEGVPTVRPLAEDVLILKPDLVVRSYGGGPGAEAFFEHAGIPVLNVGYAADVDGIKQVVTEIAAGLGAEERGDDIVAEMDARLEALRVYPERRSALYMTPSGVTSGSGSLVHEMLATAGYKNFEEAPGWRSLPIERLAYEQPDMIAAAFFDDATLQLDAWSAMRHPLARQQMANLPTVRLQGAWTSCGAWYVLDAIEALNDADVSGAE